MYRWPLGVAIMLVLTILSAACSSQDSDSLPGFGEIPSLSLTDQMGQAFTTEALQGKVVLAQHRDIQDPEHGGSYTVKVYESEKAPTEDDGWRHTRITLKPDSTEERFGPIVLEDVEGARPK